MILNKASDIVRRNGIINTLRKLASAVYSEVLRRRFDYPKGFFIDYSTAWNANHNIVLRGSFKLGKRCRIELVNEHNRAVYNPRLYIGSFFSANDDIHIGCAYQIFIGDNVLLASKIYISDHNHGSYRGERQDSPSSIPNDRPLECAPVRIGNNVWIGEMVSILPGVTIGDGAIIGSNSVVSRDVPPNTIAVGSPAVAIKRYNFDTEKWERIQ